VSFLLYSATALLLLWLVHRLVRPLSRGAAVVLFSLPLVLVGPALTTDRVYGPIDHLYQELPLKSQAAAHGIGVGARNASAIDVISEFFPWRRAVQLSLERGEWPLWNGYNLAGHPLAAEAQSAPYSPFTLIACLLPAAVSLSYSAAVGLLLAALSAFLFARELELGESAALFAAAGWAFAACNVVYILTAMGLSTVYMPFALMAARRVVWQPGIAAGALLTVMLTLTTLQGHPESLFLNVLVGCAYALFEMVRRRAAPWRSLFVAIGSGVVAVLLCAIFLLPLLEAIPQSIEYRMRQEMAGVGVQGVSGTHFLANLATDLFPHLHVRWWAQPELGYAGVETAAAGSLVLAFAVYSLWRRRSAETWFFAAMTVACAIIGARWSPIAHALQRVPLLNITHHERLAFAAALFLVMLAAMGVEAMMRRSDFRAAAWTMASVLAVLSLGMWWLSGHITLMETASDYGHGRAFAEISFLTAAVLLLASSRHARVVLPALLALLVGQRWLSERETFGTFPAGKAYPAIPILEPLKQARAPFRIVGRGSAFPPAMNTFYELEDPRGYEALTLDPFQRTWKLWCRRYGSWFNGVDSLSSPFLSFLNVRYAIQADTEDVPAGWRRIAAQPGAVLLQNDAAVDRIFVPKRVVVTEGSAEDIVLRMIGTDDFREIAWITRTGRTEERSNGPGRIMLREHSVGGRYAFDAYMEREGFVVLSDPSWIGWQATVDGKRMPLDLANAAFIAVFLPAGQHSVQLVYRPQSFVIGRAITFATLLLLAIAWGHTFLLASWRGEVFATRQRARAPRGKKEGVTP